MKQSARLLRRVGFGLFLILATLTPILYTRAGGDARVHAAANNNINFQARLLTTTGGIVPDGNTYSLEFKLYSVSTGGVALWTESLTNQTVKNGYISVSLGSVTPFPGTINWSEELWLTMNVNSDGEMNPRLKLTGVPLAFRAKQADTITNGAGTLTANDLVQLAPSSVQAVNSALAALRINQQGTGLLAQLQGDGSDVFTISKTGAVTAGTYNTNTFTGTGLTFGAAAAATIQAGLNQGLSVLSQGTGGLTLTSGSGTILFGSNTLQNVSAALTLDVSNAGLSTFNIVNNNGANLANLDVEGGIFAGNSNAFSVNSDGDITSVFTALNGTSTANGGSGLGTSTSLILTSAANFEVGGYVQMNSANCGGTGINPCYAKITAKGGAGNNTLTIAPALRWTTGSTVNEYHVPEVGGTNAVTEPLTTRYGRGYFISGVATGNGTTFYNEDSIDTSLSSFDLLNTGVTTLNIGGAATTLNLGVAGGAVNILGNFATSGASTITAGGGLTVSSGGAIITGGIDNNSGGITEAGAVGGVAGLTFTSGSLNLASGGVTNTGSIAGATTLALSGAISGATATNTINGLIINSGALSGISTINASGAITAATATNTINGLIVNAGALSGITGVTFTSGSLNLASGGITNTGSIAGATTLALSGAITGATATNTINGLIINSGVLSGITGMTFTSGSLNLANGGITNTGSIAGATSISLNGAISGGTTLGLSGAITGATSTNTINGLIINSGALSGITTINASGAITGATATNTINGLVINSGALSSITSISASGAITAATTTNTINGLIINSGTLTGITGATFTSGNLALGGGNISGVGTLGLTGAITGATATNTINGLVINSGALTSVTGITFTSGSLNLNTGGITNAGSIAGASTINASGLVTSVGLTAGSGLVQGTGGLTITGATSINASASTSTTNIGTGTTSGQVTIGGGSAPLVIDSTAFDVSSGGALSGITTIGLSGAITGATSGNTINGLIINAGALSGITTINTSGLITSVGLTAGTGLVQGTGGLTFTGAISLNATAGTSTTNIGTGTTTGQVTIGGGTAPLVINSTAFDVSVAGALSGITTINTSGLVTSVGLTAGTGLIQGTGGLTISGATVNLNDSSNFATNINTGSSTGTVTIGGGTAPLVINSTAFDVSSTGALSGITTINASGLVTSVGLTAGTGLIQGTGGLTITGAAVSLNASSNFAINIGTGTSTGAVTIGGGSNTFAIASTGIDISTAGAITNSNSYQSVNNTNLTLDAQGTGSLVFTGYDCSGLSNGGALTTNASGVVACSADDSGISDARLKKNVTDLNDDILDRIKEVRTVNFDFDCDQQFFQERVLDCRTTRQTGVIAQELAQVFPELVYQAADGYYRVKYDALNIYTLKAVGKLADKVDTQAAATGDLPEVKTGGTLRLGADGSLQNITGLNLVGGGASVVGGLNNNNGGITNAGAISGATTVAAESIRLTANSTDNLLELKKDATGVFTVFNNGALQIQLDSANVFTVKDAAGTGIFNIDSQTGRVNVGSGSDNKTVLFVLDNRTLPDDPPGTPGASYYNTVLQRFRCYEGTKWQDCLPVGDLTDPFVLSKINWLMPATDTEFIDTPRLVSNLYRTHEYRLRMRVLAAAPEGAKCRIQFAKTDTDTWNDAAESSTGELAVDQAGTLKTDWIKLKEEARAEDIILRVMCKGGNGSQAVVFNGVSMQLR